MQMLMHVRKDIYIYGVHFQKMDEKEISCPPIDPLHTPAVLGMSGEGRGDI